MSADNKARILVVEHHAFVREGIVRLINSQQDLVCCSERNDFSSHTENVTKEDPDLILVDIPSKDEIRFETIDLLKLHFPEIPVVVLSETHDQAYVKKVLRAGASGYVTREDASGELIDAIRAALDGKSYFSRTVNERVRD